MSVVMFLLRNWTEILARAVFNEHKIKVTDVKTFVGGQSQVYKVFVIQGVKIAKIRRCLDAFLLNGNTVRMDVLPDAVGIEMPNDNPSVVPLRSLLNDKAFRCSKAELPVAIGFSTTQKVKVFDLAERLICFWQVRPGREYLLR